MTSIFLVYQVEYSTMTTSGLPSQEITKPTSLYRTPRQLGDTGESFRGNALFKRVGAVLHALAPIGYEDESGFYFGEQQGDEKGASRQRSTSKE